MGACSSYPRIRMVDGSGTRSVPERSPSADHEATKRHPERPWADRVSRQATFIGIHETVKQPVSGATGPHTLAPQTFQAPSRGQAETKTNACPEACPADSTHSADTGAEARNDEPHLQGQIQKDRWTDNGAYRRFKDK